MYLRCGKELTAVTDCLHNSVWYRCRIMFHMRWKRGIWVANGSATVLHLHTYAWFYLPTLVDCVLHAGRSISFSSLSCASRRRKKREKKHDASQDISRADPTARNSKTKCWPKSTHPSTPVQIAVIARIVWRRARLWDLSSRLELFREILACREKRHEK